MTGTWSSGFSTGDVITATEYKKQVGSIYDTTLGGSAASIDITGIVATYAHLMITIYARGDTAALTADALLRFNGDTAANYDYQVLLGIAGTPAAAETFAANSALVGRMPAATAGANLFGSTQVFVPHYAGSSNNKEIVAISGAKDGTATSNMAAILAGSSWRSSAAINQITLLPSAGNLVAGTRVTIHAMGA